MERTSTRRYLGGVRHVYLLAALLLLFQLPAAAQREDLGRNNEVVERLRAKLAAGGVNSLPKPPHQLGVHTACLKHGASCPDSYVEFLEKELLKAKQSPSASTDSGVKMSSEENWPPEKSPNGAKERETSTKSRDNAVKEVELENMRRLRNVLSDRLEKTLSLEFRWQCLEMFLFCRVLRVVLTIHESVTMEYWGLVVRTFLPCIIITAIITWIFFADRIPTEHLSCLLSDDPSVILSWRYTRSGRSRSLADLVIEREKYNNKNEQIDACDDAPDDTTNESGLLEERIRHSERDYCRARWILTRFSLLESYEESRLGTTVLKLRLVLTSVMFLMLVWTLFSLPLRASDLHGGDGLFQRTFALFCPPWMTTSVALYVGLSWIGGMVGYAGWELVSAGEELLKSDERTSSLQERILLS